MQDPVVRGQEAFTHSPCLQTVAVSLSIKALLKKNNNNMCAVTDKVWAIKGVGSWGGHSIY